MDICSQQKLSSDESDGQHEGNILETPASSEKRYRAALLKNRFADIILKAREKPLPQVCTYLQFSPSLIALSGHWIMLLARTPVKVVWL
jgi:hypothetical protein